MTPVVRENDSDEGSGYRPPHGFDLDGYDRARDERREDEWDRRERESVEQERDERGR